MRSKRSWAWAGLGASSLLAFLTACGDVNEDFKIIVVTPDAGQDAAPSEDATVADAATDAASDATSDATIPDGSVQDAQVDAAVDAGSGPVVPDGGSIVIVGDAAVVVPPFDPGQLGIDAGALVGPDGGALLPSAFAALVNDLACRRISECCCPGCSAAEQSQAISRAKCVTGLPLGVFSVLTGNDVISAAVRVYNERQAQRCMSFLSTLLTSCASVSADQVQAARRECLGVYTTSLNTGDSCAGLADCPNGRCIALSDAGTKCEALAATGESCRFASDCTFRGYGPPFGRCAPTSDASAAKVCQQPLPEGASRSSDFDCVPGSCQGPSGAKRCTNAFPFAAFGSSTSYCSTFAP